MGFFRMIILALPLGTILFWWFADRRLRPLRRQRVWRSLLAAFAVLELFGYGWFVAQRFVGGLPELPIPMVAAIYVWHLVILPITLVVLLATLAVVSIVRLAALLLKVVVQRREDGSDVPAQPDKPDAAGGGRDEPGLPGAASPVPAFSGPTRRQFLAAAAVAAPPLLTGSALTISLARLHHFRIRHLTVPLPNLPPDLDGMTIAHVTDVHVGKFTDGPVLRRLAEATNDLRADLVLMTGDLIDHNLADLPSALDMVRKMQGRYGLYTVEGNHDLFQGRLAFERGVMAAGVPLLLNESLRVVVRGQPVQLLGIRWGGVTNDRRDAAYIAHVQGLRPQLQPDAFPILLAHHPHAFDPAADIGIPLTLAGHTHGGQLMLTDRIGPGPLMYKYYSGLYTKPTGQAAVISNGAGNWFPLRTNAPAEIVHLTLRRA